jgi:hypothetical protein
MSIRGRAGLSLVIYAFNRCDVLDSTGRLLGFSVVTHTQSCGSAGGERRQERWVRGIV